MKKLIASAPTIERLEKLINAFYYSTTCKVDGDQVHNSRGPIPGATVETKKGRHYFYLTIK